MPNPFDAFDVRGGNATVPQKSNPFDSFDKVASPAKSNPFDAFDNPGVKTDALPTPAPSSAAGALTRGITHNLFPSLVGAGGALGGAALGALTTPVTGPAGIIAGDVGGAIAGTALGEKIQRGILPESTLAEMDAQDAADREAHPIASGIGSMIGSVPLMLTGGGIPTAMARAGLKRAGVEATTEAINAASRKALPRMTHAAATFAGMSGGAAAAEKVKGLPGSEDISIANEAVKGAVGGVAMAGTGKVLEKFVPMAKTYLGGIGIRAPTDAMVLATANSLYDTTVNGKPFNPVATAEEGGMSIPAFMLMNAAMGGRGRAPAAPEKLAPLQLRSGQYDMPALNAMSEAQIFTLAQEYGIDTSNKSAAQLRDKLFTGHPVELDMSGPHDQPQPDIRVPPFENRVAGTRNLLPQRTLIAPDRMTDAQVYQTAQEYGWDISNTTAQQLRERMMTGQEFTPAQGRADRLLPAANPSSDAVNKGQADIAQTRLIEDLDGHTTRELGILYQAVTGKSPEGMNHPQLKQALLSQWGRPKGNNPPPPPPAAETSSRPSANPVTPTPAVSSTVTPPPVVAQGGNSSSKPLTSEPKKPDAPGSPGGAVISPPAPAPTKIEPPAPLKTEAVAKAWDVALKAPELMTPEELVKQFDDGEMSGAEIYEALQSKEDKTEKDQKAIDEYERGYREYVANGMRMDNFSEEYMIQELRKKPRKAAKESSIPQELQGPEKFKGAQGYHSDIIRMALQKNLPVNAAAVEAYTSIKLPEGYTREGDRYVFKPLTSATPKGTDAPGLPGGAGSSRPDPAAPQSQASPDAVTRAEATAGSPISPVLENIDALTEIMRQVNENTQKRIAESGIDLSAPPVNKADAKEGETVFDQKGRPWIVGKNKKMIPTFSQPGIQGVQNEIVSGKEYPFENAVKRDWGWYSNIATWRRPAPLSAKPSTDTATPSPPAAKAVTPPSKGGDTSLLEGFLQRLREAKQRAKDGGTGLAPKRGQGQSALGEIIGWQNQGAAYPKGFNGLDIPLIEKHLAGGKLTEKQNERVQKALEFVKQEHQDQVDNLASAELRKARQSPESEIPVEELQDGAFVRKNGEWLKVTEKDGELTLKDGVEIPIHESMESIKANGVVSPDNPAVDIVEAEYAKQEKATSEAKREDLPALEVQTEAQVKAEKRAAAVGDTFTKGTRGKPGFGEFKIVAPDPQGDPEYFMAQKTVAGKPTGAAQLMHVGDIGQKVVERSKFRTEGEERTTDEITGLPTRITGKRVSAQDASDISRESEQKSKAFSAAIKDGKSTDEALETAGISRINDLKNIVNGENVVSLGEGVEGKVYADAIKEDVVYKVWKNHAVEAAVEINRDGKIILAKRPARIMDIFRRISVSNRLGLAPTEIVGVTRESNVVTKMPFAQATGDLDTVQHQADISKARAVPDKILLHGGKVLLAYTNGRFYLVSDINRGNLLMDIQGRTRMHDSLVSEISQEQIKKVGLEDLAKAVKKDVESIGDNAAESEWRKLTSESPAPLRRDFSRVVRKILGPNYEVEHVDRLVVDGLYRLGRLYENLITIVKNGDENFTLGHEISHAWERVLTPSELEKVKAIEPNEENRADAFAQYFVKNGKGVAGQLRRYFDRAMFRLKQLFGTANGADELKAMHARLMDGVYGKREAAGVAGAEPAYRTPLDEVRDSVKDKPRAGLSLPDSRRNPYDLGKRLSEAKDSALAAVDGLKAAGRVTREAFIGLPKVTDWRKAIGEWSYQLQTASRSAHEFSKDIRRVIPDARTSEALTNYLDAGGDEAVLRRSIAEAPDRYKRGYQDALNLSPEQKVFADKVRDYYDKQGDIAVREGWISDVLENYINRVFEKDTPWKKGVISEIGAGNIASGKANFLKKRMNQYNVDAEKAGVRTVKDVRQQLLAYDWAFAKTMADRAFVKSAMEMTMSDGRPRFDVAGSGTPIKNEVTGEQDATLIKPFTKRADKNDPANNRADYIAFDHPAFRKWKWTSTDSDGKPILVQGQVLVHPDALKEVKAFLGKSAIAQVPALKTAMRVSSTVKQTMLDLSGFHFVQIGVHGLEHRVNPFNLKKIDISDPTSTQAKLVKGGLMIADTHGHQQWSEGLSGGSGSLFRHVPVLGEYLQAWNETLFKEFIPRMKMTMAEHALERNRKVYAKDLAAGRMTEDSLHALTANESNAAFGHLNYEMLGRSKTTQDLLRLTFLAPDFLEARGRFAAQAFTQYGAEQRVALALGAAILYVAARILNKTINDEYHLEPENAFSLVINGRSYSLRTVQGDIIHMFTEPSKFAFNRLNPVYGRTSIEFLTGRDAFGRKRDFGQQLGDLAKTATPISLRSHPEQRLFESFMNAFGMTNKRYSAVEDVYKMAEEFRKEHSIAATREVIYDPDNDPLHMLKVALSLDDTSMAVDAYKKIMADKTRTPMQVAKYFREYPNRAFTGSRMNDAKFRAGLNEEDKKIYNDAVQERRNISHNFFKAMALANKSS